MVESPESCPLIGREDPQKMFKGGTLTILNLCHSGVFGQIIIGRPDELLSGGFSVVAVTLQWSSGKALAKWQSSGIIGNEFGFSGRELVSVALQWHSGTQLTYS